jgi:glycosyltransferase involved in cell wall biosynthesis
MKIGVVVDNEFFTDVRVLTEVEILKNGGHEVFVLHLSFPNSPSKNIEGVKTTAIPIQRKKKDFVYATMNWNPTYENLWIDNISKFIDDNNIEALHVHDLYMAKSGRLGIEKSKKKIDLTLDLHENYPHAIQLYEWATKFPRNLLVQPKKWLKKEKEYLLYGDKIVVLSDFFANQLSDKYSIDKSRFVVYPNVPNVSFFDGLEIDNNILDKGNKITLFYFGVVARRRGIYTLLDGYEKLKKEFSNLELLIIGPVDKNDKEKLASRIENTDDVIHYPWKDMAEFPSYVSYSDICVSPLEKNPQHESGVANKVYQYMLFGKPVLVSNCGPQEELVETTKCGLVFNHDSVSDFIDKARTLILNREELVIMGENGRNAIIKKYNMDNYSLKFLELYSN